MLILCLLAIIGLQTKIVSCDCSDLLLRKISVRAANSRTVNQKFSQLEGDHFWASSSQAYVLYNFSKTVKVTTVAHRENGHVSTYSLAYSSDGINFIDFKTENGYVKVIRSKTNQNADALNHHFEFPIIAQYIRINLRRGKPDDFAKIKFYGCDYEERPYYFNGSSLIKWNLLNARIKSNADWIRFRFRTFEANGVFIYGRGVQNDSFVLMLKNNEILLIINLGTKHATRLSAGSLLDDGLWHNVIVSRKNQTVKVSVDGVSTIGHIHGDFAMLNLDHRLYIGGVPRKQFDSLVLRNYTGCVDDLSMNWIDITAIMQKAGILRDCPDSSFPPLTFLSRSSFVKFVGLDKINYYDVSFTFRTYEELGLLMYHEFSTPGYVKVFLKNGRLWTHLLTESSQLITMQSYEEYFSDGRWHHLDLSLRTNNLTIVVDENPVVTIRLISILSGANTFIGGRIRDAGGFIGCIRKVSINKRYKQFGNWQPNEEYCCKNDILFNSCRMVDRCNPNPCEHGGICHQTATDFSCDCSNTGYGGAVCHKALLPINCNAYGLRNGIHQSENLEIDIDGSGPLAGFPVECFFDCSYMRGRGRTVTALHHENEATTTVDGFQDAGSYVQTIAYHANADQIEALTKQSSNCWQNIRYECFRSKLLNSPSSEGNFNPFSWWVSHYNQKMDFWGGAVEGSRKCECGIMEQCKNATKWCNCDAGYYEWRADGGDIVGKEYLPVKQLRFGDTGSLMDDKKGKYTLGPLYCEGDDIFSNVITLRKSDVAINLGVLKFENSYDFHFEFRTGHLNGIIVECIGHSDKFVISLEDGKTIRFVHEVDGIRFDIFAEHSSSLSNNEWHNTYIEVNRKEIRVIIDGNERKRTRNPDEFLVKMELSSSFSIGGSVDPSTLNGFVGCLRAFLINGNLVDLVAYVHQFPYGLSVGCIGKCISNPCLNNGTCLELYDSYMCDCRWTSFKGPICADEIGASFNGYNGVIYEFPSNRLSTISENIRVGFSTTHPQGFLLGLQSSVSKEYMTIGITNSGHIRVIFDFGFERQEIIYTQKHFNRGQFHDLRISRTHSGSVLRLEVDDYEPIENSFNVKISADAQFDNVEYLYIGKNRTSNEGFIGCISRVEFNDIYPLKLLFQQNPPNSIFSSGSVHEDFCGVEPVTLPPEPIEDRPFINIHVNAEDSTLKVVAIWSGLFLFLIMLVFLLGKYTTNRRAFYHTQEQSGAEGASDADNAVIHSKTGHVVFKKREWFI